VNKGCKCMASEPVQVQSICLKWILFLNLFLLSAYDVAILWTKHDHQGLNVGWFPFHTEWWLSFCRYCFRNKGVAPMIAFNVEPLSWPIRRWSFRSLVSTEKKGISNKKYYNIIFAPVVLFEREIAQTHPHGFTRWYSQCTWNYLVLFCEIDIIFVRDSVREQCYMGYGLRWCRRWKLKRLVCLVSCCTEIGV